MQFGPIGSSSKRLRPVCPLGHLLATGGGRQLGTWFLTGEAYMNYQRYNPCRDEVKNLRDHFRVIRTNSCKRLQHKFRRKGLHSLFLLWSNNATWSNKWSYRPNNSNHNNWLEEKFVYDLYLNTQKQAHACYQNINITSNRWWLNSNQRRTQLKKKISIEKG